MRLGLKPRTRWYVGQIWAIGRERWHGWFLHLFVASLASSVLGAITFFVAWWIEGHVDVPAIVGASLAGGALVGLLLYPFVFAPIVLAERQENEISRLSQEKEQLQTRLSQEQSQLRALLSQKQEQLQAEVEQRDRLQKLRRDLHVAVNDLSVERHRVWKRHDNAKAENESFSGDDAARMLEHFVRHAIETLKEGGFEGWAQAAEQQFGRPGATVEETMRVADDFRQRIEQFLIFDREPQ
jgi:hypothetical protein